MARRDTNLTNINAEKAVLGAILRSEHAYWQVSGILRAEMFANGMHQKIYGVVRDICEDGRNPSFPLVRSKLPDEDEGGRSVSAYLSVLMKDAEDISPADFANDIAEMAARRAMIKLADRLRDQAANIEVNPTDLASEAEAELGEMVHITTPRRPRRLSELVTRVLSAATMAKEQDILPGFGTGILSVDEILGRIMPGDLGFLLGSQGDGKSALATQIGVHVALSRPVLMFQFEMAGEAVAAREVAEASRVTVGDIYEGAYDMAQKADLENAQSVLQAPDFYVHDCGEMTLRQVRAMCLHMKKTSGLGMVIVDQLDKLKAVGRYKDRFERMTELTSGLKNLAKELTIPFVVLAQRTRGAQRRDDPTPQLLDADAPSIERDADWVLAVWREENWLRQNRPDSRAGAEKEDAWYAKLRRAQNSAKVITLKRRRGKAFEERELKWDGNFTRFREP